MSEPARKVETDEGDNDNLPVRYRVGYGKPPAELRFKKGQSGNPKGRPRGARNKRSIDFGFGNGATEELLKQEAYRTISVREGDQVIELPVIQAVFRAMGVAALKGNRFARRNLAEMVKSVEAQDWQSKLDYVETMYTYKRDWTKEIERCRRPAVRSRISPYTPTTSSSIPTPAPWHPWPEDQGRKGALRSGDRGTRRDPPGDPRCRSLLSQGSLSREEGGMA
jgi:hypothetical protein